MRNSTDRKKLGAVVSALIAAGVVLVCALAALAAALGGDDEALAAVVLGLYGLLGLAVAAGIFAALRQRLREIRGGEEEDARKY